MRSTEKLRGTPWNILLANHGTPNKQKRYGTGIKWPPGGAMVVVKRGDQSMISVARNCAFVALCCGLTLGAGTAFADGECAVHGHHACQHCSAKTKRWSADWWAEQATRPIGARQLHLFGKLWPPFARPVGEPAHPLHTYHAAHYWPHPYYCQDRSFVRSITERQIANGWITSNTLFHYHFDRDTDELNHSGILHLNRILADSPNSYRFAFVETDVDTATSQNRLASVRLEAERMVGDANVPPIMLRVAAPVGRPAAEIQALSAKEMITVPAPRVEYQSVIGGG